MCIRDRNQAEEQLRAAFPGSDVLVVVKEGGAAPRPEPKLNTSTGGIAHVIAVASGKGGVGKSTVKMCIRDRDHVGFDRLRLDGERQRVAQEVGYGLHLGRGVVVRQNHGVLLALEFPDAAGEGGGVFHVHLLFFLFIKLNSIKKNNRNSC